MCVEEAQQSARLCSHPELRNAGCIPPFFTRTQSWTASRDFDYFPPVPSAAKPTASPKSDLESVAFEESLNRLESVVAAMETGELPLEKMLSHYEEGMRLAQVCQGKLTDAELKIEQLEKTTAGELTVKSVRSADSEDE